MRYAPPGLCLNDFTLLDLPDGYHVVHLQGPWNDRFDERSMETSYGHARSTDLVEWETLGPCFGVGRPGAFDASAIWTMHAFPCAGGTAMTYTGVRTTPRPEQAIGLAFTDRPDATGWMRVSTDPLLVADPRWYRTEADAAWRDPFVVREQSRWAMVLAASSAAHHPDAGGCLALALSDDLLRWETGPPVVLPGDVPEVECPALERTADGWLLLACVSVTRRVHCWVAEDLEGPWTALGPVGPAGPYAPRLVDGPAGERLVLHTSQRRTGLANTGTPCRGTLAQPKLLDLSDPLRPRLRWWPGAERHIERRPAEDAVLGLVDVAARPGTRVLLRGTAASPELVLDCAAGSVALRRDGGAAEVRAELDNPLGRIKILQVGEYVEVYADDVLVLAELDYRAPVRPALLGAGRTVPLPVRPVRSIGAERDDVSALASQARVSSWVLPGSGVPSRGSPLVGRIRLRQG